MAGKVETDVLVIGGGMAGTFAAIKAMEASAKKVTLVSKGKLGKDSIATFGAGVWVAILPEDDKERLFQRFAFEDYYGGGVYDKEWADIFIAENYDRILDMDRWGVEWEKDPDGKFQRIQARRKEWKCMFHGPQMMEAMAKKVMVSGVEVVGHTIVTDLLTENGRPGERIIGAVGFDVRTGEFKIFKAKATILAAGGCGFKSRFACHRFQTGEAYAAAYRAGAKLGRLEMGQVNHTTSTAFDTQGLNMFVGLGGKFVNAKGKEFMLEYDPGMGNHATMARVSEASAMEIRAGRGPIYLDMTHFTPEDVKKLRTVLPIPTMILERTGNMVGDKIVKKMEWAPAFFGTIATGGGMIANIKCETSLPGLYTCGDAMARTMTNLRALPGAAVSGARAGRFATEYAKEASEPKIDEGQVERLRKFAFAPLERKDGIEPDHIIIGLLEMLIPYEVTVISRGDRLEKAIKEVERMRDEEVPLLHASDAHYLRLANEAKSMVVVAEMYLRSRLLRKESRGSCLREDYPYTDNIDWLKNTVLKQENGKLKLWTEDIPVEKYEVEPKREKYLHKVFEVANKREIKWG